MNLRELYDYLLANCYREPAFTLKPGMLPAMDNLLSTAFGAQGLQLSQAGKPQLNESTITVAGGQFAEPWLKVKDWRVDLEFTTPDGKTPVMEMRISKPGGKFALAESFNSLEGQPAGIMRMDNFLLKAKSDEKAPDTFLALQSRFMGALYYTDEDMELPGAFRLSGSVSLPPGMEWLTDWFPESVRQVDGLLQVKANDKDSPRFLLSSPRYEIPLPGYFGLEVQMQAVALWIDAPQMESKIGNSTFLRLLSALKYKTPEGEPVSIPIEGFIQTSEPGIIYFKASTGAAVTRAMKQFESLLGGLNISSFLPEGMAVSDLVTLRNLVIQCNASTRKIEYVAAELGLPEDRPPFPILPGIADLTKLKLLFTVNDPLDKRNASLELSGGLTFRNAAIKGPVTAYLHLPSGEFFLGLDTGSTVNLTQLYQQLLPGAPVLVEDLLCTQLAVTGYYKPAEFQFAAGLASNKGLDLYFLKVTNLSFGFSYSAGNADTKTLTAGATVLLGNQLKMQVSAKAGSKGFEFSGALSPAKTRGVTLKSLLPAGVQLPEDLADTEIDEIKLSFSTSPVSLTFTLKSKTVLNLGAAGKIQFNGFTIEVTKGEKGYTFKFITSGKLNLIPVEGRPDGMIDLSGQLTILRTPEKFTMALKEDGTGKGITLPLLIPSKIENGVPEFSEIEFVPKEFSFEWASKDWKIESEFKIKLTKAWKPLLEIVPADGVGVKLIVGKEKASLKLSEDVLRLPVGDIVLPGPGEEPPLNLGPSLISVGEIGFTLEYGKKMALTVETTLSYFLPSNLNLLFGKLNGKPKLELFETYDPAKPTTPLAMTFKAGYVNDSFKAGVVLSKFPLKNLAEENDGHWLLNLGPIDPADNMGMYGCIRIRKPDFNFNTRDGGFKASGGWWIKKQLALPTDLIRNLLINADLEELARRLPPAIPIPNKIEFFKNGKFNTAAFTQFFPQIPEDLVKAMNRLADATVNKFPDAIKPYFTFGIPDGLNFDVVVTATGSASIDISVPEGNDGVRMLTIPGVSPFLMGVTLRKFSFGQIFGGQAFRIKVNADFDLFDFVSLAASVVTPEDWYPYTGVPQQFHNQVMLHDLVVLVFYQAAGIPIPVPLFYSKVGVDYYGIGGNTFKSSFEFPEPDWGQALPMLGNLIRFFTQKKFPMPEEGTAGPTIRFTINETYFQSALLKLGPIGLTKPFTPVDLYKFLAQGMNAVKFFDIEAFIKSIPVDLRVGKVAADLSFIAMKINASWLICTPEEFVKRGLAQQFLKRGETPELFLNILPGKGKEPITDKDKGLVMFARGEWITSFGTLNAGFGAIALNAQKFGTGFFLKGFIAIFEIDAKAYVAVDPPERPFQARGEALTMLRTIGLTLFQGETNADLREGPNKIKQFYLDGKFTLLDVPPLFSIKSSDNMGGVLSSETLDMKGGVALTILGFLRFSGSAEVGTNGVEVIVKVVVVEYRLTVRKLNQDTLKIGGALPFGITTLSLDVTVCNPEHGDRYVDIETSSSFAGLITLIVRSRAPIFPSPPSFEAEIKLFILRDLNPNPIVSGKARIGDELEFTSSFSLLPNDLLNIRGSVRLTIGANKFFASGSASLYAANIAIVGGTVEISDRGIRFFTSDGNFNLEAKVCGGKLYLIGRLVIAGISVDGYIAPDGCLRRGYPDECRGALLAVKKRRPAARFDQFNDAVVEMTARMMKHIVQGRKEQFRSQICEKKYTLEVKREVLRKNRKKEEVFHYKLTRNAATGRGKDLFTELLAYLRKKGGSRKQVYLPVATRARLVALHSSTTESWEIGFHFPGARKNQVAMLNIQVAESEIHKIHELLYADFAGKARKNK